MGAGQTRPNPATMKPASRPCSDAVYMLLVFYNQHVETFDPRTLDRGRTPYHGQIRPNWPDGAAAETGSLGRFISFVAHGV